MSMAREKFPSDHMDHFNVRLPEGMRDDIKASAATNCRSMNAEIIARLSGDVETLRDRFAGQALVALGTWMPVPVSGYPSLASDETIAARAEIAYRQADAMLAARKAGEA